MENAALAPQTEMVPMESLKFSPKLLELRHPSTHVISEYRQAMRVGAKFPALVVDPNTMQVICGTHRLMAYLKEMPEGTQIEVIFKNFDDKVDLLKCAVLDNLTHGYRMDPFTQRKFINELLESGMPFIDVAALFDISAKKAESLMNCTVAVEDEQGNISMCSHKRGPEFPPGTVLNREQYTTHAIYDRGTSVIGLARQITRFLEWGWVDLKKENNILVLKELKAALKKAKI